MLGALRKLPFLPGVGNRLRTAREGAETDPEVLRGLACGAHMKYSNGEFWNTLLTPPPAQKWERYRLEATWDVTDHGSWERILRRLLDGEVSTPQWDLALGAREDLLTRYGHLDQQAWRYEIEQAMMLRQGQSGPYLTAMGERLHREAVRVERYEAHFRQEGLLTPQGWVRRTLAWDLGRAANMACWGVAAGFAGADEARAALRTAGALASKSYGTWAEYSAGYVLGRCMHFDEDRFGSWYREVRDSHRVLLRRPDSPWNLLTLR